MDDTIGNCAAGQKMILNMCVTDSRFRRANQKTLKTPHLLPPSSPRFHRKPHTNSLLSGKTRNAPALPGDVSRQRNCSSTPVLIPKRSSKIKRYSWHREQDSSYLDTRPSRKLALSSCELSRYYARLVSSCAEDTVVSVPLLLSLTTTSLGKSRRNVFGHSIFPRLVVCPKQRATTGTIKR